MGEIQKVFYIARRPFIFSDLCSDYGSFFGRFIVRITEYVLGPVKAALALKLLPGFFAACVCGGSERQPVKANWSATAI